MVTLRIAITGTGLSAFLEISLGTVLADIHIATVRSPFMLEGCGSHALHHIQLKAVTNLHGRKIRSVQFDCAVLGILICGKCTVVQMTECYRHTIPCPGKVFRFKHQIAAGKINAALTEASDLMTMRTVGIIHTIG